MKAKIIAYKEHSFIENSMKEFIQRYNLKIIHAQPGKIVYEIYSKNGEPLVEIAQDGKATRGYVQISLENQTAISVDVFEPKIAMQKNKKKGGSSAAFYLAVFHFAKQHHLPDQFPVELYCYSSTFEDFYDKMKEFGFQAISGYTEFNTRKYSAPLPDYFRTFDTTMVVDSNKTADMPEPIPDKHHKISTWLVDHILKGHHN